MANESNEMRQEDEVPVAFCTIAIYGKKEQISNPSGSGDESAQLYGSVPETLQDTLLTAATEVLSEQFSDWNLRAHVTPIN